MKAQGTKGHWREFLAIALMSLVGLFGQPANATETTTYVLTDVQGTVLAREDAHGTTIATYDYRPYGKQQSGPTTAGPSYTGHVSDSDTGLVYMQARYYDPDAGRFFSIDAVVPVGGNVGSFNRYAYVVNNPIMHVDPTGMVCGGNGEVSNSAQRMRDASDGCQTGGAGASGGARGSHSTAGIKLAAGAGAISIGGSTTAEAGISAGALTLSPPCIGIIGVAGMVLPRDLADAPTQDPALRPLFRVMEPDELVGALASQQYSLGPSGGPKYFASTYSAAVYFRDHVIRRLVGPNVPLTITVTPVRPYAYAQFEQIYLDSPPDRSMSIVVNPIQMPILNYEAGAYGIRPIQ